MKKVSILIVAAMTGLVALAETNTNSKADRPRGLAAKEWIQMKRFGGMVRQPRSAKGKVLILNAQKRVASKDLTKAVEEIDRRTHTAVEVADSGVKELDAVAEAVKSAGGKVGIALLDRPGLPALITVPEESWAVVNIAKLAEDAPKQDALNARVRKEILRAFGLVGGAAFMCLDPIVMRPDVRTPADLDVLVKNECYGIDAGRAFERNLPHTGITPWRVVPYALACQEGWAPAPTNEFQKAIWDKARALPTNPIKIKYDPKKGE